ncbi:unnamed protein product [Cyprideis torosa]|uniref:Ragulator complex protein LAMTOR2 homolog n=1 Tax=Cyprideis torosa TaxID=163714 RepID=A0A7R8ZJQ0_9CRUS|nr:unnamed protein product [Cyprideis torosa]CAG0887621.1 unnamed protein product [Cyprideis torosa]
MSMCMIRTKVLTEVLSQVNTGGVLTALLLNSEGALLAYSGTSQDKNQQRDVKIKAAIASNVWSALDRNGKVAFLEDELESVLIENDFGLICVAKVANLLLCLHAKEGVGFGMLQLKTQALIEYLQEPLMQYYVDDDAEVLLVDNNVLFKTKKDLKQHYLKVHGEKKFVCEKCDSRFPMLRLLREHINKRCVSALAAAERNDIKCLTCSQVFSSSDELLDHSRTMAHAMPVVMLPVPSIQTKVSSSTVEGGRIIRPILPKMPSSSDTSSSGPDFFTGAAADSQNSPPPHKQMRLTVPNQSPAKNPRSSSSHYMAAYALVELGLSLGTNATPSKISVGIQTMLEDVTPPKSAVRKLCSPRAGGGGGGRKISSGVQTRMRGRRKKNTAVTQTQTAHAPATAVVQQETSTQVGPVSPRTPPIDVAEESPLPLLLNNPLLMEAPQRPFLVDSHCQTAATVAQSSTLIPTQPCTSDLFSSFCQEAEDRQTQTELGWDQVVDQVEEEYFQSWASLASSATQTTISTSVKEDDFVELDQFLFCLDEEKDSNENPEFLQLTSSLDVGTNVPALTEQKTTEIDQ